VDKLHKRIRIGYASCILLVTAVTLFGCNAQGKEPINTKREVITRDDQKITLLKSNDTQKKEQIETSNSLSLEKIDKYKGLRGEDWIDKDILLVTKVNTQLEPIPVFDAMENIRNLYLYNLKTGEEKSIFDESQYLWMPIISPDKKYIFVQNLTSGKSEGLIINLKDILEGYTLGEQVVTISEENTEKGLHLSYNNAKWISNEELIVPTSNNGVCLINVNSNIVLINDIGSMQTDTAVKVGNKIYYISVERNLMSYDVDKKQNDIIKENVLNFELSPEHDMFAIEKKLSENESALVLINLDGTEKTTLAEAKMIFGISWSPDQSKLAYIQTSEVETQSGLYITKLEDNTSLYVSSDFVGVDNWLRWNPTSTQILASIGEVKDMKLIDNSYVISLK
jgi:TolB protein